ncbi:GAF domain-containing protein [Arachidicoccus rhizosphaerae]|uniref:GAF domain-containing protein n=1 Tax=Arachidicoccus rhizosphaerae TaxID=551991 RepID=A0A1H3VRY7_9BACT|nr:GAF domain-containing protein [Arachidicoccus rhizosphaerae]SDZ77536.1 GAF domain-containing protein [Arachidicoccus rhizosphaerae]
MSESIVIIEGTRQQQYESLLPQISAIITGETDLIANMANISSALKEQFNWWWVGFYLVKNDELVLGPFQGPIACTRIKKGRGVCGGSWAEDKTLIVQDVNQFPGHIACSSRSQSEIVLPVRRNGAVIAVLDIDSELLGHFDELDQKYLEQMIHELEKTLA